MDLETQLFSYPSCSDSILLRALVQVVIMFIRYNAPTLSNGCVPIIDIKMA